MANPDDEADDESVSDDHAQECEISSNVVCCIVDFNTDFEEKLVVYEVQCLLNSVLAVRSCYSDDTREILCRGIPGLGTAFELMLKDTHETGAVCHIPGAEKTYYLSPHETCDKEKAKLYRHLYIPTSEQRLLLNHKPLQREWMSRYCPEFTPQHDCYPITDDPDQTVDAIQSKFAGKKIVLKCPSAAEGTGNAFFDLSNPNASCELKAHLVNLRNKYDEKIQGAESSFWEYIVVELCTRYEKKGKDVATKGYAAHRAVLFHSKDGGSHAFIIRKYIFPPNSFDSHNWTKKKEYYRTVTPTATEQVFETKSGKMVTKQVEKMGRRGTIYYESHDEKLDGKFQLKGQTAKHLEKIAKVTHSYFEAIKAGKVVMVRGYRPRVIQSLSALKDFLSPLTPENRMIALQQLEACLPAWIQSYDDLKTMLCCAPPAQWTWVFTQLILGSRLFCVIQSHENLTELVKFLDPPQWLLIYAALENNPTEAFETYAASFLEVIYDLVTQRQSEVTCSPIHLKAILPLLSPEQGQALFSQLKKENSFKKLFPDPVPFEWTYCSFKNGDVNLVDGRQFYLNPETIKSLDDLQKAFLFSDFLFSAMFNTCPDIRCSHQNPDTWLLPSSLAPQTNQAPVKTISLFFPKNTSAQVSDDTTHLEPLTSLEYQFSLSRAP